MTPNDPNDRLGESMRAAMAELEQRTAIEVAAQAFLDGALMVIMADERYTVDERLHMVAWACGETAEVPAIVVAWEAMQGGDD